MFGPRPFSQSRSVVGLYHFDEFQPQRVYPVEQRVKAGLIKITGKHRRRRLDIDIESVKGGSRCWSDRADDPDLVTVLCHRHPSQRRERPSASALFGDSSDCGD